MTENILGSEYAAYIISAYLIGLAVLLFNLLQPWYSHRRVVRELRARLRREQQS